MYILYIYMCVCVYIPHVQMHTWHAHPKWYSLAVLPGNGQSHEQLPMLRWITHKKHMRSWRWIVRLMPYNTHKVSQHQAPKAAQRPQLEHQVPHNVCTICWRSGPSTGQTVRCWRDFWWAGARWEGSECTGTVSGLLGHWNRPVQDVSMAMFSPHERGCCW